MKYLTMTFLLLSFSVLAQDKEGDLQLPVSDVSQMQKQEEKKVPTLDEVEMQEEEPAPEQIKKQQQSEAPKKPKDAKF